MKDRLYRYPPIRAKRTACTQILCAYLGSSSREPVRRYPAMTSVHCWPSSWLSSMALQVDAYVMEGSVCTCMGNKMASLMGREAVILARASARTLSARGIFSMVHSSNCCRVSLTFVRYRAMRSSLARIPFARVSPEVENRCRLEAWRQIARG